MIAYLVFVSDKLATNNIRPLLFEEDKINEAWSYIKQRLKEKGEYKAITIFRDKNEYSMIETIVKNKEDLIRHFKTGEMLKEKDIQPIPRDEFKTQVLGDIEKIALKEF